MLYLMGVPEGTFLFHAEDAAEDPGCVALYSVISICLNNGGRVRGIL